MSGIRDVRWCQMIHIQFLVQNLVQPIAADFLARLFEPQFLARAWGQRRVPTIGPQRGVSLGHVQERSTLSKKCFL